MLPFPAPGRNGPPLSSARGSTIPQVPDHDDPPVLELDGLCRAYGGRMVVDHVDLVLHRGEILGFLGPNGAGKTTTIRMALNLVRPSAGTVRVLGSDVWRGARRGVPPGGAAGGGAALSPPPSGR